MSVAVRAFAWSGVVVGMALPVAWAGSGKPPPVESRGIVAQPTSTSLASKPGENRGFVLLTLAGHTLKWGKSPFGSGAVVRYAFVSSETDRPRAINCRTLIPIGDRIARSSLRQPDFVAEVRRAMDDWSAAANIEFRPVADPAAADLLIGGEKDPRGIAYTDVMHGDAPGTSPAPITHAAICFNLDLAWEKRFDGDPATPNVRYVAAHELGHSLGLDHAWGTNKLMRFRYEELFYTPQPADIAGAVFLYGARPGGLALVGSAFGAR